MASLLERIVQLFRSTDPYDIHGQEWPPTDVRDRWAEIGGYRTRYENKREILMRSHPSLAMSQEMRETFIPVPFGREICRFSSSLLFSETPKVKLTSNEDLCAKIERVVDFGKFCVRGGVKAAVEGRIGIRIVKDPDVADVPILTLVSGDQIIWDVRHGDYIVGGLVIITREVPKKGGKEIYRLLEDHRRGEVERRLFKATSGNFLGDQVPLDAVPEFANLLPYYETGLNVATLIPWDNVPGAESDLFGLGSMFDELNEAETWLLDACRKCVPRIFVDRSLIDSGGRAFLKGVIPVGKGSIAPAFGQDPSKLIIVTSPHFDAEQHIKFIAHVLQMIVTTAGFAPMTWGIQGQTANVTRAVSGYAMKLAQLRTLLTRSNKEHMALQALGMALAICMAWHLGVEDPVPLLPVIELGDGLPSDPLDGAQEVLFLAQAAAASTQVLVETVHPTWTPVEVAAEVGRIQEMQAFAANLGATNNGTGTLASGILRDFINQRRGASSSSTANDDVAGSGIDNTAQGTMG